MFWLLLMGCYCCLFWSHTHPPVHIPCSNWIKGPSEWPTASVFLQVFWVYFIQNGKCRLVQKSRVHLVVDIFFCCGSFWGISKDGDLMLIIWLHFLCLRLTETRPASIMQPERLSVSGGLQIIIQCLETHLQRRGRRGWRFCIFLESNPTQSVRSGIAKEIKTISKDVMWSHWCCGVIRVSCQREKGQGAVSHPLPSRTVMMKPWSA